MWYWTMKPSAKNTAGLGDVISEGQITEMEEFLKKMTKMLQFQLELVDMKFGKEVEGLKKDFLLWARVVAGWCIILKGTFMGMEGNGVFPQLDLYSRQETQCILMRVRYWNRALGNLVSVCL